jgi:hypothetical protein
MTGGTLVIVGLAGLLVLGVAAELFERRAERRLTDREDRHKHRRLMDEIRRHT